MDRLYNNEAFVGCAILKVLMCGTMDMARMAVVVPLLVNDKMRNYVSSHKDATIQESIHHSYSSITLNRIYKELLIIEINSLVMLSQADLVLISPNGISLTKKGHTVLKDMKNVESNRLKSLSSAIKSIMSCIANVSTAQLYKSMNIQL